MATFATVCSGIGAPEVAAPPHWQSLWACENDPAPMLVLDKHFPDMPIWPDLNDMPGLLAEISDYCPDILIGGTPCQSFSVSGQRESLNSGNGQLMFKFIKTIEAIESHGKKCTAVWENVPGVLNTKDNAFGQLLGGLVGTGEILPENRKWGRCGMVANGEQRVVWRVLDAQYFGVPQQRKRVFVVRSSDAGIDPAEVLFERTGSSSGITPQEEMAAHYVSGARSEIRTYRKKSHGNFVEDVKASTMVARDYKSPSDLVLDTHGVRGYTPVERERLMGFPDHWTDVGVRDSARVRMLGNSMAVPVVRWILNRIDEAM